MNARFRIIEVAPGRYHEEEWPNLSLEEAAARMDGLTGVGADVILADFDEDCGACEGSGKGGFRKGRERYDCPECHGTGKRSDPWEFIDPETGRDVMMMREVH